MNANCEACALGPVKIDGHDALMVHILAVAGMLFKCRECELTWMRSYSTEDRYEWTRLPEPTAATLPLGIVIPAATRSKAVAEVSSPGGEAMDHWLAIQHSWKHTTRRSP